MITVRPTVFGWLASLATLNSFTSIDCFGATEQAAMDALLARLEELR